MGSTVSVIILSSATAARNQHGNQCVCVPINLYLPNRLWAGCWPVLDACNRAGDLLKCILSGNKIPRGICRTLDLSGRITGITWKTLKNIEAWVSCQCAGIQIELLWGYNQGTGVFQQSTKFEKHYCTWEMLLDASWLPQAVEAQGMEICKGWLCAPLLWTFNKESFLPHWKTQKKFTKLCYTYRKINNW